MLPALWWHPALGEATEGTGAMPLRASSRLVWIAGSRRRGVMGPFHRDEVDGVFIDFRPRVGPGIALTGAQVTISRLLSDGTWDDVTAEFQSAGTVIPNPPSTIDEKGQGVGGAGWVLVGPIGPATVVPGRYAIEVWTGWADNRRLVEAPLIEVINVGDPE